jgi:hypothetical protein
MGGTDHVYASRTGAILNDGHDYIDVVGSMCKVTVTDSVVHVARDLRATNFIVCKTILDRVGFGGK